MNKKLLLLFSLLLSLNCVKAGEPGDTLLIKQKSTLVVLVSPQCPFCERWNQTIKTDKEFSNGIQEKYNLVNLSIDSDEGKLMASRFQLKKVPAFIVLDPQAQLQQIFTGFSNAAKLAGLLQLDYKTVKTEIQTRTNPFATCGNGIIETGESCDDNNTNAGDGCSAACNIENGYVCIGAPSVCTTICGDGMIAGTEACDDGNQFNGDGCSTSCSIEPGFYCSGFPSVCTTNCGDGMVAGPEECDDQNMVEGDGCSSVCTINPGYQCSGQPSICQLIPVCGNGTIESGEACDDANTANGDGCSSACAIEPTYICTGQPSICFTNCGNGVLDQGEECDDANQNNGDGCSNICMFETNPQGVAVNQDNTRPHPSSMLDVKSNDKGILIPRLSTAQRTGISNPAKGLLVFDTTTGTFWFFNGTIWKQLASL